MNNSYIGSGFFCKTFASAFIVFNYAVIIQELFGHYDFRTSERYAHVSNRTIQGYKAHWICFIN